MSTHKEMKEKMMALISSAPNQRLRPRDMKKAIGELFRSSRLTFSEVLKNLIDEGALIYTYRDPCSFIEVPDEQGNATL
ncbi:MAG: hypothetical protein HN348_23345 [Proteobacteria bacterium]|nr:hypothetical protein [Pseudomonadota bacterium]